AATVLLHSAVSSFQSEFRTNVRTPSEQITRIASTQPGFHFALMAQNMTAAAAQSPTDGRYKKRSAMMLPIVMSAFDVGNRVGKKKKMPHEMSRWRFRK